MTVIVYGIIGSDDGDGFCDPESQADALSDRDAVPANRRPESFKYIDDTTVFEAVSLDNAIRHITGSRTQEVVRLGGLEMGLVELAERAEDFRMRVNVGKTQLLCISPN